MIRDLLESHNFFKFGNDQAVENLFTEKKDFIESKKFY